MAFKYGSTIITRSFLCILIASIKANGPGFNRYMIFRGRPACWSQFNKTKMKGTLHLLLLLVCSYNLFAQADGISGKWIPDKTMYKDGSLLRWTIFIILTAWPILSAPDLLKWMNSTSPQLFVLIKFKPAMQHGFFIAPLYQRFLQHGVYTPPVKQPWNNDAFIGKVFLLSGNAIRSCNIKKEPPFMSTFDSARAVGDCRLSDTCALLV